MNSPLNEGTSNQQPNGPTNIEVKINGMPLNPADATTLLGKMKGGGAGLPVEAIPAGYVRVTLPGGATAVVPQDQFDPGIWTTYVAPALPYVGCFFAGAALGALGTAYFMGGEENDIEQQ